MSPPSDARSPPDTAGTAATPPFQRCPPSRAFYEDAQNASNMERQYAKEPPVVAVEVLSPNDRLGRTLRRTAAMLSMGVKQVWIINPKNREATIYRTGRDPEGLAADQEIVAEDILPGFRCRVADFFGSSGAA